MHACVHMYTITILFLSSVLRFSTPETSTSPLLTLFRLTDQNSAYSRKDFISYELMPTDLILNYIAG